MVVNVVTMPRISSVLICTVLLSIIILQIITVFNGIKDKYYDNGNLVDMWWFGIFQSVSLIAVLMLVCYVRRVYVSSRNTILLVRIMVLGYIVGYFVISVYFIYFFINQQLDTSTVASDSIFTHYGIVVMFVLNLIYAFVYFGLLSWFILTYITFLYLECVKPTNHTVPDAENTTRSVLEPTQPRHFLDITTPTVPVSDVVLISRDIVEVV